MNYNRLSLFTIIASLVLSIYSFFMFSSNIIFSIFFGLNNIIFPIIMLVIFFVSRMVVILNKKNNLHNVINGFSKFVFSSLLFFLILQFLIFLINNNFDFNFSLILTILIAFYFIFTGRFINSSKNYLFLKKRLNIVHKNEGNSFISLGIVLLMVSFNVRFSFLTIVLGIIMSIFYLFFVPE